MRYYSRELNIIHTQLLDSVVQRLQQGHGLLEPVVLEGKDRRVVVQEGGVLQVHVVRAVPFGLKWGGMVKEIMLFIK